MSGGRVEGMGCRLLLCPLPAQARAHTNGPCPTAIAHGSPLPPPPTTPHHTHIPPPPHPSQLHGPHRTALPPPARTDGHVRIYRFLEEGRRIELVHSTAVEGVPGAMAAFKGRLLVGVDANLRLYDMGERRGGRGLLRTPAVLGSSAGLSP